MTLDMDRLRAQGVFSALDRELARGLCLLACEQSTEVELAIALLNRHTREGHVRLDLEAIAAQPLRDADGEPLEDCLLPSLRDFTKALKGSKLVASKGQRAPLVLDKKRFLYLSRYFEHERALASALASRAHRGVYATAPELARSDLARTFGQKSRPGDLQRLAAQVAALQSLAVITGGPGTGKTTTVVRVLAVVLSQLLAEGRRRPRTLLLAPTGKAAARLMEAVERTAAGLDVDPRVTELIPRSASTIHRALQSLSSTARERAGRPGTLAADIVVVDEASMVDIALMRSLVDAVPADSRLILLGDADQLASVEAGAVLADICGDERTTRLSPTLAASIRRVFDDVVPEARIREHNPALSDCIVHLEHSHRFGEDTEIGRLSAAIRRGEPEATLAALDGTTVRHIPLAPERQLGPALADAIVSGFRAALASTDPVVAVRSLEKFRILCAHRHGPGSVEVANDFAERTLARAGLIEPTGTQYPGRPILVTHNDRSVDLFNGDVGIFFKERAGPLRAVFPKTDGGVRFVSPARLPAHETAFAMSIHKSQGSEFDRVAVLLPEASSTLLSRELLYTAVTRARQGVAVYGTREAVRASTARRVTRDSGLAERLYGN